MTQALKAFWAAAAARQIRRNEIALQAIRLAAGRPVRS